MTRAEDDAPGAGGPAGAAGGRAPDAGTRPPRRPARFFALRGTLSPVTVAAISLSCVVLLFALWALVTAGPPEERIVPRMTLPSPGETFESFRELWFERALTRNTLVTIRRVGLGFLLAALIGVPLGILCGCFAPVHSFFLPLTVFGRNIPVAALIPLTFAMFRIGEMQKVMFIFIASVMFVVGDTTMAVRDVQQRYVDTAWTLGARRWQIVRKVLAPLAMPQVFDSLRLLFGLAFGYIMLAELVKLGDEVGGLGHIISQSQRRGMYEHIWLVLLIIPFVAVAIDRLLFAVQKSLFPYRYGGRGRLRHAVRALAHAREDALDLLRRRPTAAGAGTGPDPGGTGAAGPDAGRGEGGAPLPGEEKR